MIKQGDFVRIKEKYAFEENPLFHYGHCVEVDGGDIKLNWDRRYGHDSFIWVKANKYEKVNGDNNY